MGRYSIEEDVYNRDESDRVGLSDAEGVSTPPSQESLVLLKEKLRQVVQSEHLSEREQNVLKLRLLQQKTLAKTANEMGTTGERVRQIQGKAILKLRRRGVITDVEAQYLNDFINTGKLE